ncbi:MAG: hypothetical protein ACREQW_03795 [Candidatus Binatia bacterium]
MVVIEPQNIDAVLLNDGWHTVHGRSFSVVHCEISMTGVRHGEWRNAATWRELTTGATKLVRSITVPFETVLGIQETGQPYTAEAAGRVAE